MKNILSNLNGNGVFKYSINNQQNANQKVNSGNNKLPDANWVSVGTVENLTIDEIMDMFAHGNLTKTEMEKWLVYHRKDINNLSYTEQNGLITYKFEYKGKEFKIQCSTEAAADQKDQKTQETFLLSTLENVYHLTNKQISENFVAAVSVGGNAQCYALDPKSEFKTIAELVEALNTEEPEDTESAIVCAAANTNGGDIDVDGLDVDYTQLFPEDYRNMIQTHLGQTIQELGEKAKSKNLSLVFDEIEVNKGRIVAQDEDGMYYYLNKLDNEFVRLKPQDWTQIVLTGKAKVADESGNKTDFQMFIATDFRTDKDKYINMSDVTRCINRELTLTGVSTYAIFKRNDSINIDDLYALLSNSNDTGVQKLFKEFNKAFEKYGCKDDASKEDVLKSIIILLNNKYGIPNTSPVTLSKELVKTLNAMGEDANSGVIYKEIDVIANSQPMEFKYGLDGEFGNVTGTSNSRLASALFALQERSDSTEIIEKIKESMQWNSNLTKVTVTVPSGKTVSLSIKADSKYIYGPNINTELLGRILAALKGTSAYQEDYFKSFFGENADIKTSANPESSSVSAILNGIQTAQEGTDPYSAVFKIDTKQAIKDVNNQTVNLTTISNAYGVGRGYAITSVNSDTVEIYQLCEKKSYIISKDVFSKNIQFGSITTMGVEPQEDTPASQVNNDTDNNDQAGRTEERITAEYIISNLTALSKSSNAYVKSFITTLKNAFTTYSCTTDEQKTKMAESFIKLYNQNNTPALTAANINDMTKAQNTTMTTISKSEALKYTYNCDGVVDLNNVVKGTASAGNVSAVLSIASSKEGQNVISDIINNAKWSSDYKKVTVTVPSGKTVTITPNAKLVTGDLDGVIMSGIMSGLYSSSTTASYEYYTRFFGDNATIIKDTSVTISDNKTLLNQLYYSKQNGDNFGVNFVLSKQQYLNCTDGTTFAKTATPTYVGYSITDITEDTVTFVDNTSGVKNSYTMSWTEFRKLKMYSTSTVQFNNLTEPATLLDKTEGVDANYIVNNLAVLRNSTEAGVKDFIALLDSAFEKFECFDSKTTNQTDFYEYDKKELVNYIIRLYNNKNGIENTEPAKFNQATLKNLTKSTVKTQLNNIINSTELYVAFNCDEILEDSKQSNEGNCWALSGIQSIAASEAGAKLLEEAITWHDDGSFSVYFAGVDKTITLSAAEVESLYSTSAGHTNNQLAKSGSDLTMLLMQHAIEEYQHQFEAEVTQSMKGGFAFRIWSLLLPKPANENLNYLKINGANTDSRYKNVKVTDPYFGTNSYDLKTDGKYYTQKQIFEKMYQNWQNGKVACCSFNCDDIKEAYTFTTVDGKKQSLVKFHEYSITNVVPVDNTYYITITNPWDSKAKSYTVTYEEFLKFNIEMLEYFIA